MKNKIFLILILILTSCASSKIIELGGKASTEGVDVSQKAIDVYSTLSNQRDIDKSQQDKVKVLTNPKPETMNLPNTDSRDFSIQLEPRINAYKSLLKVYKAFALLTDNKYSDKTQEAVNALQDSYNSIDKLPDLSSTVSEKLPSVAKLITEAIQAKQIKKHNEILYGLSQAYLALWNADKPTWNEYIDRIYNDYSEELNTVVSKRYDAKKISQDNKEPYSDEAIIILMYRLRNRDEIAKQRDDIKKQLNDFGKALEELSRVHSEIAKQKTDVSIVISSINKIEELLKEN
ncbi:MAG: hypothetical protein DI529_05385 [Chryseobacterium sp.]|nr:MAG: hypothetical protein DI529_05385 [Chryseobacterium sp.]